MHQRIKKNILYIFLLIAVILVVFGKLPYTFYQQDEWNGLGLTFAEGIGSVFNGVTRPLDLVFAKGRILSNYLYFLFLDNFPFQNMQMAVFAIVLHSIATILVYVILQKFIKNRFLSFLGALFFAVNAVSQGGITWAFVAISTAGGTILILFSLLCFFEYIRHGKRKWLIATTLLLYLSLWFKENSLYLFLFFPFSLFLFKKYSVTAFLRRFWIMLFPFVLIVGYRILDLKLRTTTSNLYITGASDGFFSTIIFRLIFYPLTSFSLLFVPGDQFLSFARITLNKVYPFLSNAPNNALIVQTVVLDLLSFLATVLLFVVVYIFLQKEKSKDQKIVIFWIAFTLMSFLPYVLLSKDFSYLESRYYYLSVVGGAFIFSWLLKRIKETFGLAKFVLVIIPFCLLFLFVHAFVVYEKIEEQLQLSTIRRDYIKQQKQLVPTLRQNKNIFYVTSDKDYWAEGNKIPFQQGSGYTYMVLYYDSGKIPKQLLSDQYLFDIGGQGYKEVDKYGFGFFWDKSELEKVIEHDNISSNSIHRLYYDSSKNNLRILK